MTRCLLLSLLFLGGVQAAGITMPPIIIGPGRPSTGGSKTTNQAPVTDAGPDRYLGKDPLRLDGTGSYDPDGTYGLLTYSWKRIGGTKVTLEDADTATPTVSAKLSSRIRDCVLQLVVSDGRAESEPDTVRITLVADYKDRVLELKNPPFDPQKPTIVAFSGGNGVTGGGLNLSDRPEWFAGANVLTKAYGPPYELYADFVIATLSQQAPNYDRLIQTIGSSTGGQPAVEVAHRLNAVFNDSRYWVNRVSLLDTCCRDYRRDARDLLAYERAGESFWIDNYTAKLNPYLTGCLNIAFPAPAVHSTPRLWYKPSPDPAQWPEGDFYNEGIYGGYFSSVAGPARLLQLAPDASPYYFTWRPGNPETLHLKDPKRYPGSLPEPMTLSIRRPGGGGSGVVLSCLPARGVTRYQLLMSPRPGPVDDYVLVTETASPPSQVLTELPYAPAWWTVRGYDEHGSVIHARPRVLSPANLSWPVTNLTSGQRFASIQEAIDLADVNDTIEVLPGTYYENLVFYDKGLYLTAQEPLDPSTPNQTLLTSLDDTPVLRFQSDDGRPTILNGFTISGSGHGLVCEDASPVVEHCTLIANRFSGVQLRQQSAPQFIHCVIAQNQQQGISGLSVPPHVPHVVLSHCVVAGNGTQGISNVIVDMENCTIVENRGIGLQTSHASLRNSIVYYNDSFGDGLQCRGETIQAEYCTVEGEWPGPGNIQQAPIFARLGRDTIGPWDPFHLRGDYHLQSRKGRWDPFQQDWVRDKKNSPCIDKADPQSDIGSEVKPNGKRCNQGAYGGTAEASLSD